MRRLIAVVGLMLFTARAHAAPPSDAEIRAQASAFLLPCHGDRECRAAGQTFVHEYLLAIHGSHANQWMMTNWFSEPTPVPVVASSGRQYCAWLWILIDGVGSHYKDIDLTGAANRCDGLPPAAHSIVWSRYQALRHEIHTVAGRTDH